MTRTRPALPTPATRRGLALLAGGAVAVVVLAGCSSSTSGSGSAAAAPSAAPSRGAGAGAGGRIPGTSGTIAAVTGSSMEVQNPTDGQVTVTWTSTTAFTNAATGTLADATVGSCVTAGAAPTASSGASPSTGGSATRPTSFTATTVQVTVPTNGSCDTGRGGFGGGSGGSGGSGAPSGRPSGSRGNGGFGGFGERAAGTVTAVSGDVITVAVPAQGSRPASTDTVTTTSSTTFTDVVAGSASDATVGRCALAIGKADDTGSVTATRIALSSPGPDGCTTGFGRRGGAAATGSTGA